MLVYVPDYGGGQSAITFGFGHYSSSFPYQVLFSFPQFSLFHQMQSCYGLLYDIMLSNFSG